MYTTAVTVEASAPPFSNACSARLSKEPRQIEDGSMPASVSVIPAKAGIQKSEAYNSVPVGKESRTSAQG